MYTFVQMSIINPAWNKGYSRPQILLAAWVLHTRVVLFLITFWRVKCNKKVLKCLKKGKGIQVKFSVKQNCLRRSVMAFPIRKVGLCFHCFATFSWAPLCLAHGISKRLQAAVLLRFEPFENDIFLYVLKRRFTVPQQNFSPTDPFIKYICKESED